MASEEQSVVAECALQLRTLGDLIYWKYVLLEFLTRTVQAAREVPEEGTEWTVLCSGLYARLVFCDAVVTS